MATEVTVEGSVIIRIIKHCRENRPQLVFGELLGLDFEDSLDITNCFPHLSKVDEEEDENKSAAEAADYAAKMLRCLQDVNADNNQVGWYASDYNGKFFNENTIETQYNYQKKLASSVVLVYDPVKTAQGSLTLKAYRLTDRFMDLYKTQQFTRESLAKSGISYNAIYTEVPIKIHNSLLSNAFLLELEQTGTNECDLERFDLQTNPFLEKTLENLIGTLDELSAEQTKFQFWQKSVQRQAAQQNKYGKDDDNHKALPEPSRLDSLVYNSQIDGYCQHIKQFSGNNFAKLWLVSGVSKET